MGLTLQFHPLPPSQTGFVWRGVWSVLTPYIPYDVVSRNNSSYVCITGNTGIDPATDGGANWQLMAAAGSQVTVNGSAVANPNFNDTTPAAPGGFSNVTFQKDGSGNVSAYVASGLVTSVFGRAGVVVAGSGDYSVGQITGAAPILSPAFSGTPTAPTPVVSDNSTAIATTAFVKAQGYGVAGVNTQLQFNDNGTFGGSAVTWDKNNLILTLPAQGTPAVGAGTVFGNAGSSATATANVTINVGDFVVVIGGGSAGTVTLSDNSTALVLTSVQNDANGRSVYQGTITGGANNAHAGKTVTIAGFASTANNGVYRCIASTATSLTLNNKWAITETHAGTAANTYILITDFSVTTENIWVCPSALVAATTITVGAPTNPSVAAATFTGIGGIGAYTRNTFTTSASATLSLTTTAANSMVVTGFLYVRTAGTITASSSSGTLRTNSDSGTNTFYGTAIVTQQATTIGSYTNAIALSATATTAVMWSLELLPAGTAFNSDTLKLQNNYWNGASAATDFWTIQALPEPTLPYVDGYMSVANVPNSVTRAGGIGKIGGGSAVPPRNVLQIGFTGEGGALVSTPAQNVLGSVALQKLSDPAAPTVTPTGGAATTWGYKIVAFDSNNMCTAASAQGTTAAGAATLTPSAFNTITWLPVIGAAYYNVYRTQGGTLGQISQVFAGQPLSVIDDGTIVGVAQVPSSFNWTGSLNVGGQWVSSGQPTGAGGRGSGLAFLTDSSAFIPAFIFYSVTGGNAATFGTPVTQLATMGFGITSDANDRFGLHMQGANFGLSFLHNRTTLTGDPGIGMGGATWQPTGAVTAVDVSIGQIGGEQSGGTAKFAPVYGPANYNTLRISPTIQQTLVTQTITSASITNATTAVLTLTVGTGIANGATVTVSGLVNANNLQLNGTWTVAGGGGTTSVTITGSGWTAHGASGGENGTLSQQATGNYTGILFNVTETAIGGTDNRLLDLQVGAVSCFTVNNKGHINNLNGDVTGSISSVGGATVSKVFTTNYVNTPYIVVTPTTNAGAFYLSAVSNSGFTITYATTGAQTFNYHVFANVN